MSKVRLIGSTIWSYRNTIVTVLTPLVFLPIPFLYTSNPKAGRCAYGLCIMGTLWCTEAVPIAATALLPILLFPWLGVLDSKQLCSNYFKDTNFLYFSGLLIAVAVENCDLHKRLALKVMCLVGSQPKWLMFGFMSTTAFLSMWLSNTATTAMLMPIAYAVIEEMDVHQEDVEDAEQGLDLIKGDADPSTVSEAVSTTGSLGHTRRRSSHGRRVSSAHGRRVSSAQGPRSRRASGISAKSSAVSLHSNACLNPNHDGLVPDSSILYPNANLRPDLEMEEPTAEVLHPNFNLRPDMAETVEEDMLAHQLREADDVDLEKMSVASTSATKDEADAKRFHNMATGLKMSIAFAANIGGTGTLTGTGPNIILKDVLDERFGDEHGLNFGTWVAFGVPNMLACLLVAWLWMQLLFLGPKALFSFKKKSSSHDAAHKIIQREYKELGPITFAEISVIVLFCIQATLWFTRDPAFMPGWGSLPFLEKGYVTDACVGMTVAVFLFFLPSTVPFRGCSREKGVSKPSPSLLQWDVVHRKMSWGVIILMGGSFAMSDAVQESGLSQDISELMDSLGIFPPWCIAILLSTITVTVTNVTSNTATATIFLPIVADLAVSMGVHPLYFMLPVTISASLAFMLPVATPPNAIVFAYGDTTIAEMMKAGSVLNILCIVILQLCLNSYARYIFGLGTFPDWARGQTTPILSVTSGNISHTLEPTTQGF